jgi:hypothetical protein
MLISEFTARTFLECAEDDLAVWAEQDDAQGYVRLREFERFDRLDW